MFNFLKRLFEPPEPETKEQHLTRLGQEEKKVRRELEDLIGEYNTRIDLNNNHLLMSLGPDREVTANLAIEISRLRIRHNRLVNDITETKAS